MKEREDKYAEYSCGHIEEDDTSLNEGEKSYCNTCKTPAMIVSRLVRSQKPDTGHEIKIRELVNQAMLGANSMMKHVNTLCEQGKITDSERISIALAFGATIRPLQAIRGEEPLEIEKALASKFA